MTTLAPPARGRLGSVALAYQWELEKLSAQFRTRLAGLVCLLGPWVFGVGLTLSSAVPADTLFGRWVGESGYATTLVVLGFAGSWGFPLLACLVAGDIFSAEDHHRTWTSILSRSLSRRSVFGGKVLAAATYVVAAVTVLALSSLACGVVLVGSAPLVGLSGNILSSGHAAGLVLVSWLSVLPAVLAFAALGILVSVATRNSLAGIIGPTVVGLVSQLLLFVNGLDLLRPFLPNASFVAWHGLFAQPSFTGPVRDGIGSAVVYAAGFLGLAWLLFRRRDITGS